MLIHRKARFVPAVAVGTMMAVLSLAACGADASGSSGDGGSGEVTEESLAEAREFYEGKTVRIVVCFDTGGGFDVHARALAPYLAEELGADVIVENLSGGGGLVATNQVLKQEEADGLTILTCSGTGTFAAMLTELDAAAFTWDDIAYIGRFTGGPQVIVAAEDGPFDTWDEVLEADGVGFGATGPGAGDYYHANLLNDAFDLDLDIVTGFESTTETTTAVIRDDVQLMARTVNSKQAEEADTDTFPILTLASERIEFLPDTPSVFEYDLDESWTEMLEVHAKLAEVQYPIMVRSDIDAARLETLREAFDAATANSDYLADISGSGELVDIADGAFVTKLVNDIREAPQEYRELLTELSS